MKRNLTLARYLNESVIISVGGHDIEVKVMKIGESQIKLNFEAGDDVMIVRKELLSLSQ